MDPKKVWGLIIIILGVISILYGFNNYSDHNFLEKESISTDLMLSNMVGKSFSKPMVFNGVSKTINSQTYRSIIFILIGIAASIVGALMISLIKSKPSFIDYIDFEGIGKNYRKWKF